jgi:hypothetical protein
MEHPIYRILRFSIVGNYSLEIFFDDGTSRLVDFEPILKGPMYGPLKDLAMFRRVRIDPEIQTLVWPNGADFDPETLHEWSRYWPILRKRLAAISGHPVDRGMESIPAEVCGSDSD